MNAYKILNVNLDSTLLEICYQFQNSCLTNPSSIFTYTDAFSFLTNPLKKLNHDATIFQINIFFLYLNSSNIIKLQEDEEYELANFISWLEDFREYFYDSKFYYNEPFFLSKIESWYDQVESIIEDLKKQIHSFYLT